MRQLLLRQGQGWKAPGWNVDGKKRKGLTYGDESETVPRLQTYEAALVADSSAVNLLSKDCHLSSFYVNFL